MLIYVVFITFLLNHTKILAFKKSTTKQDCSQNTADLISLMTLVCNNIDNLDQTTQCVQCFTNAARASNSQPSIVELQNCASIYLTDTTYDDCVTIIQNADPFILNGQCIGGYCAFVRCLRRKNSDNLILQCYNEAFADNDLNSDSEQIRFYKNITSCILANARCLSINPITGKMQTNSFSSTNHNKLGIPTTTCIPLYNALQVNRAGDLRVIALPGTTTIQKYLCPYELNLMQSSWNNLNC